MSAADDAVTTALLADLAAAQAARRAPVVTAPQPVPVDAPPEDVPAPPLRDMLAELQEAQPDRLPWPDDWFDHTDSGQIKACRSIWGAALLACIRHALDASGMTDKRLNAGARVLNVDWFRSRDFHMMCALAGLDGVAMMDRLSDPARRDDIVARLSANPKEGVPQRVSRRAGGGGDV